MFFQECENFAKEYDSLRPIITKIDELIHTDDGSNLYNPQDIASFISEPPIHLSIIFEKLFELGLFLKIDYVECQNCDNLMNSEECKEILISDDLLECTRCEHDLLDQEIHEISRYRLKKSKVLDKEKRSQKANSISKTNEITEEIDFGIITALPEERDAVLNHLDHISKEKVGTRTYYLGEINFNSDSYKIVLVKVVKMGNVESALATSDLINNFNPNCLAMIGIAGGIQKNGLDYGDVVFADQIIAYEYVKILPKAVKPRISSHPINHSFIDSAQNFNWKGEINATRPLDPNKNSKLFIGPIASGNKVVASNKIIEDIESYNSHTLAVEMEGEGVCTAAWQLNEPKKTLIIRGISDMADDKKNDDWHLYASSAAAKFFIDFLESNNDLFS